MAVYDYLLNLEEAILTGYRVPHNGIAHNSAG